MKTASYVEFDGDAFAPRTEEQRFRIYVREGGELTLLATTDTPGGIGTALVELDEDERRAGRRGLVDRGVVGVNDGLERRWIILPWERPNLPTTFGRFPLPLEID